MHSIIPLTAPAIRRRHTQKRIGPLLKILVFPPPVEEGAISSEYNTLCPRIQMINPRVLKNQLRVAGTIARIRIYSHKKFDFKRKKQSITMNTEKNISTDSSLKLRSSICLLAAALIWGTTFVAQSIATGLLTPYTYNACRFLLGFLVLLPVAILTGRKDPLAVNYRGSESGAGTAGAFSESAPGTASVSSSSRLLLTGGILCGLCLFLAGSFQQTGIQYTTAGKSGFITALYIVLVPILGLFLKRRCSLLIAPAVVLAVIGFYLLCIKEGFSINKGDAITLGCSFMFALHILTIDHYSPLVNPIQLSCVQFLVAGAVSLIPSFLFETPAWSDILACWLPIVYAGVLSSGIAYTLQIIGQRGLHPAVAALLMSLESVISVLSGWLILGDVLTAKEVFGCVLVFSAVILAQLPVKPHGMK